MVFGNLSTGYWLGAAAAAGLHWIELGRGILGGAGDEILVRGAENTATYNQLFENSSDSSLTGSNNTGGSSYFNVDSTVSDALYFDPRRSASIFGQTWDLGSNLSETAWVVRAKINITSIDNSGDTVRLFIGMNNQNSSVGAGNGSNNFIGVGSFVNSGGQQWYRVSVKGNTMDVGEANQLAITTGTFYFEIIRKSETKYSVRITPNSDFTGGTLIDDQDVGGNGGSGSTSSMNLRYFWLSNINVSGNQDAHLQGNIEYVKVWNNVTVANADLTAKPYLMVLQNEIGSGSITGFTSFNGDSGSNYAYRTSENGASDGTATSQANIRLDRGSVNNFIVANIMNAAGQEKLVEGSCVGQNTAGAGNAPERWEAAGKWANTSDSITSVKISNASGGDFASGSEVVVLGYDPDDTEGTSVWEELASVELGSSGDSLDTGTFTAKKYLWVQIKRNRTGSVNSRIRVNGDSGSNYAHRYSGGANSYSESTSTTQTSIYSHAATSDESLTNYFIINKTDKEKLMIIEEVNGAAAGAGNAPERAEVVAKWTNTSAQITSIQCINTDSGDLTSGTSIKVWGFD